MKFGTKAETLERLRHKVKTAKVLPLTKFTIRYWMENQGECCKNASLLADKGNTLIVRSSALNEDTCTGSQAGKYDSVMNVANNKKEIIAAVNQVISSFGENNIENQIFIQPMLDAVKCSGVAFTIEPNTGGNYYVINYDDITGSTDSVTSGTGTEMKLFYQFKGKDCSLPVMSQICRCLKELEDIMGQVNLDVEFAITNEEILYILQVRPLYTAMPVADYHIQSDCINRIAGKLDYENIFPLFPDSFISGRRTIYGVMPDWNPAEIIGIRPKPLALSLYREIITDNIWAYQRDNYGYKNLRSFPLMIDFCGLPYIDVRVSFNSFLPKTLNHEVSEKLVNYYLDRLEEDPAKHDKVEFDIVFSCYTLDLPERICVLQKYGFHSEEINTIIASLRAMTNTIINNKNGLWIKDYEKIKLLEKRYYEIINSNLDIVSKIYWLLEDCKRYGSLPFAGLARAAFIAVQILNSLVSKNVITSTEYQEFMNEIETVSSLMNADKQKMTKCQFLDKYGHLRPGTYNISSMRYDEAPDLYFNWEDDQSEEKISDAFNESAFRLSLKQIKNIKELLVSHGLNNDVLELFNFIKTAIEGREFAKFVFTKNISMALKLFSELAKLEGFTKEDCSFANISIIKDMYSSTPDRKQALQNIIEAGRKEYSITEQLTLPPLIIRGTDAYSFFYPSAQPNYITLKQTVGNIYCLTEEYENDDITDKILLITNADPGYDWIFLHHIKGFITKWGGANSHMAIRAGELGIPAAIGVGEILYTKLCKASKVELDARLRKVTILK